MTSTTTTPQDLVAELAPEQASALGVRTKHEEISNGQYRFRLLSRDGSGYVRTEAECSTWARSHFHDKLIETFIVQSEWIVIAELKFPSHRASGDDHVAFHPIGPGEVHTTEPGIIHNVYFPCGAVLHTVKHGGPGHEEGDWHGSATLDAHTRKLSIADITAHLRGSQRQKLERLLGKALR